MRVQCSVCPARVVYLLCRSARACACTVLGVCPLSGAPIVCECMYVYVSSIWRVQPERCTYSTWVFVRVGVQCACTCPVFSMGSLSDALIVCSLRGVPIVRERCGTCCTCACTVFDIDSLSGAVRIYLLNVDGLLG